MEMRERDESSLFPSLEAALSRECTGHGGPALSVKLLRSDSLLQTTASTTIVTAAVANRCVYYATGTHRSSVYRWYPDDNQVEQIQLPQPSAMAGQRSAPSSFANVCAMFLDPVSAFHCIIATANNYNYYVSFDSSSAVELVRLRGHQIECVEWPEGSITGEGALTQTSTGDVVVGTRAGVFFLLKVAHGREVTFKQLMELPTWSSNQSAITAVRICRPRSGPPQSLCCLIQQAHLLYGFTGGPNVEHLFAMAGSGSVVKRDHLLFETPRVARPALEGLTLHIRSTEDRVIWASPSAMVEFDLPAASPQSRHPIVEAKPSIIPYPTIPTPTEHGTTTSSSQHPRACAPTKYHIVLLYSSRIVAVSRIAPFDVVCSLNLPSAQYGNVRSLLVQPHNSTEITLYSDRRVYELHFNNEQDQVWRQLVSQKRFTEALKVAPNPLDKSLVIGAEAEALFQKADYPTAADKFATAGTSAVSFEEVCLAFISKGQHRALLSYVTSLIRWLLSSGRRAHKSGIQVPVLFLWAGQIYSLLLSKAFAEDPRDNKDQAALLQRELIDLVRLCQPHVDPSCIQALYKLLESNGLYDSTVLVAECLGDMRKAVETMVSRGQTERALEQLYRYDATKERDDLICEFAPVLFRLHPRQFVEYVMTTVPSSGGGGGWQTVDPRRLLPAFRVALLPGGNSEDRQASATEYLTYCCCSPGGNRKEAGRVAQEPSRRERSGLPHIMQLVGGDSSSWTGLMNLLTQLKAMAPDPTGEEQELCRYIRTQGEMPHFDVTFALRTCYTMGKTRALTVAYGLVGQYKLAVDVALDHDDLDLAIHDAKRCRSSKSGKRKLWLSILSYEAKKSDMDCLLKLYRESDGVLTIADVLNSIPVNSANGATLGMFRTEIEKSLDQYETEIHMLNMDLEQHKKTMDAVERDFGSGPSDGSNVEGGLGRCVILSQMQRCDLCRQIIYSRPFYAFLCGHAMHKDCLKEAMSVMAASKDGSEAAKDPAADCFICGHNLTDSLFMPFIDPNYDRNEIRDWEVTAG
ncbi:Vacuolar protein sorting-associated protein 18 like protein [Perkinsus chesapeaki]|uniref:Vacuolar protein sorting-associated protein 18 like protein n=1 Tax=Perkinsus chesapeaki TaxID=330153 RepID=A0A7J6L8A1_PERCH|nr:Vacuolar protein sorting-associated protein 18 like protein [Perkinsus chesapeaki]